MVELMKLLKNLNLMRKDQTDTVKEWLKGLGFDEKN